MTNDSPTPRLSAVQGRTNQKHQGPGFERAPSFSSENPVLEDAFFSPILNLPPEIVTEIFISYLPPYPDRPRLLYFDESPLALTGICGRWRHIALSSPALWRAVKLVPYANKLEENQLVQLIKTFLDRSGS
uniref:F-box domain-containing protein n=1 Tax=Mycena chlorophos TaxID=658473 RepID=A0ABQ0M8I6_MYCCL|nr:predicted protein [Mycena chlorophos]